MDRLAAFFDRYSCRVEMFFSGTLCGEAGFDTQSATGHLHLIRRGPVHVYAGTQPGLTITEPSLLLYPRLLGHRFVTRKDVGADLVCATVDFGQNDGNPLTAALPAQVLIPLRALPELQPTLDLLFNEAGGMGCGRRAAIDCLFGYLLIQIFRHVLDNGQASVGLLAGLADRRLVRALAAIHDRPETAWSLESLAAMAGMSRARFAVRFREVLGMTAGEYLTRWRIGLARQMLKQGKPVAVVADAVGYGGAASLSRAFKSSTGVTPRQWKQAE